VGANTTTYHDPTVVAGQTFDYRVRAASDFTESGNSNEVSVTFAPAAPSGLTATAVSGIQVNLVWTNVAGETGYKIERWNGTAWTQIGTTAADVVSYQDTSAVAGASYQYRVRATNAGGDSEYSNLASVTTPNVVTRPASPSGLAAFINSNRQVQLSWKDNSSNETVFVVQRSSNGYSWTTLGSVPANSTGAIDTSAARGRVYYYRVFAYNSAGYSTASNSARVVTPSFALRTTTPTTSATAPLIAKFSGPTPPSTTSRFSTTARRTALPFSSNVTSRKAAPTATQSVFATTSMQTAKPAAAMQPSTEWSASVDALFSSFHFQ
jgi:titin